MFNSNNILNDSFLKENQIIFKKFKPLEKIGQGDFGNIYKVLRLSDESIFALKTEKKNAEQKYLESEAFILKTIQGFGIPKLISFGKIKKYIILIQQLLDKSLFELFIQNHRKVSLLDVCLIGIQIIDRLEFIHSKDFIYRDIKPANFMIGIEDPNVIYIIDFGFCKKFRSSRTGKHILINNKSLFSGTIRYASINVLKGKSASRRDDLISLGYMLIFLLKGELPWDLYSTNLNREKLIKLRQLKENNGEGKLFIDLPEEIVKYIKYTRNLKFEEDPDYSYLRSLFKKIIFNLNYKNLTFSWINYNNRKLQGLIKNHLKISKSHTRLFKAIEESSLNNAKRGLSQEVSKKELNNYIISRRNCETSLPKIISLNNNNEKKIFDYKYKIKNNSKEKSSSNFENFKKKIEIQKNFIFRNNEYNNNFPNFNNKSCINFNKQIIKKIPLLKKINPNIGFNDKNNSPNNNDMPSSSRIKKIILINNSKGSYKVSNISANKNLKFQKNKLLRTEYISFYQYISPLRNMNSARNLRKNCYLINNSINKKKLKNKFILNDMKNKLPNADNNYLSKTNNLKIINIGKHHFKNKENKAINIFFINNNMSPKFYKPSSSENYKDIKFQKINGDKNIIPKKPTHKNSYIQNNTNFSFFKYVMENNNNLIDSKNDY